MKTIHIDYKVGVDLRAANGLPHIDLILKIALATAPSTDDGIMWITEAWRKARHHDDAHTWCNAFDLRVRNIIGRDRQEKFLAAAEWIKRMRTVLNDRRYQFALHGEGNNLHIHAEFDPR